MFTGIVQGTAELVHLVEKTQFRIHTLLLPESLAFGLTPGASVAHNGCCLTVVTVNAERATFDLMNETLRVTNLGSLRVGDRVNVERAARFGDEIGGHAMSGHISGTAEVIQVLESENNRQLRFRLPPHLMKYVFAKGYIGVDGVSLTVGEVRGESFIVHLIPETLTRTTLGIRRPNDRVNIEIDPQTQVIVDTVERILATQMNMLMQRPMGNTPLPIDGGF